MDLEALKAYTRTLARRGPDEEGYLTEDDGRLGLGHTRLAILDPSPAGHQPMRSADGRYDLTYNGEVFNFIELRRELETTGHRFASDTDTEVVIEAFARWGEACLHRLNGMWAFAIWDRRDRSLFLSCDRFGIKPVFFAATGSRFAFASEMKAFFHLPGFAAEVRQEPRREPFDTPDPHADCFDSPLRGVFRLKPGRSLRIEKPDARPVLRRWWRPHEHLVEVPSNYTDQIEAFRELFDDACRLRLRSDVPIATSISGGIDSSAVLCTVAKLGSQTVDRRPGDWQRAFFADAPGSEHSARDRPFAEAAIQASGCVPSRLDLWREPIEDDIEPFLLQTEGTGGLHTLWIWALYRRMRREGIVVTLDGQGADEILGGYRWQIAGSLVRSGMRNYLEPVRTWQAARAFRALGGGSSKGSDSLGRIVAFWLLASNPLTEGVRGVGALAKRMAAPPPYASRHPEDIALDPEEVSALARLGPLGRELYRSVSYSDLPNLLWTFDILSMSHGVEIRMPFLDWRLVCFALSLPDESRLGRGLTKRILRDAMNDRVPRAIRARRDKVGFGRPIGDVLRGPLRDWVRDQVHRPSFLTYPHWDGEAIRRWVERDEPGDDRLVWAALQQHWIFESWARLAKQGAS